MVLSAGDTTATHVENSSVSPSPLTRRLLKWYRVHGRHDLPWRNTDNAWHVLLAELMLQRTRADLVLPVYEELVARFPEAADLVRAPREQVVGLLTPLGLVHRIDRIRAAAAAVADHGMPHTLKGLLNISGVGPYTAHAALCFAYGRRVAIVDPNVLRVLDRALNKRSGQARPRNDPAMWQAASQLLPGSASAREWNYALLDLGALVCRPRRPRCGECPLNDRCIAVHGGAWRSTEIHEP
jgi:A/G-specific adenine glycosylase